MDDSVVNFTPLKKEKKGAPFFLMNIVAFMGASVLVLSIFIYRQINLPQPHLTEASTVPTPFQNYNCFNNPNTIPYPKTVSAKINAESTPQEVTSGSTINAKSISFEWDPVPKAQGYYVMISNDPNAKKGYFDPVVDGQLVSSPKVTFSKLLSGKTYFFLIRSWSKKGTLSMKFPTPGNCKYALAAPSLFEFTTQ